MERDYSYSGLVPAAFGAGSPAETAQQPSGLYSLLMGAYHGLGDLAKKAIGSSEMMRQTGVYNPAPMVEAAMLPMGTGAIAGVPLRGGEAVLGSGFLRGKMPDAPKELYHVVGPDYRQGDALRSLYARKGEAAYDEFARRWPEAGNLGMDHAHKVMFYDKLDDALSHADAFGGNVLKVDPAKVGGLYLDDLEKSYGQSGFWATKDEVPPGALSPFAKPNSATATSDR